MEPTDAELMAAVARTDARAFAALSRRYSQQVYRFAYVVLQHRQDAEDVTQEVFLKLWRKADHWQPQRSQLSTWLFQVTRNAALNYQQRRRSKELPWESSCEQRPSAEPSLESSLASDQRRQQLYAAVLRLPEPQRSAMQLVYGEGLKNREAAEVLSCSVKAVESMLLRARRSLRAELNPGDKR